jgi:hypothetical protein
MSRTYSAIPTSIIESMMGSDRWNRILKEIEREYGTRKVVISHDAKAPRVYLKSPRGKDLGTVRHLEWWADKQRQKRRK